MDQKEEFEKNIIQYYNCKSKSSSCYSTSFKAFCTENDIIEFDKRISLSLCAACNPPSSNSHLDNFVIVKIYVGDGCYKPDFFPLAHFAFHMDSACKKIIESKAYGCKPSGEIFDELKNIFKTWNVGMDEFIEKLKLLNISLI